MIAKIKAYICRDVDNPNESADGAIAIRLYSLVTVLYLSVLSAVVHVLQKSSFMGWNLFFVAVLFYAFWLSYRDKIKVAMLCVNAAIVGVVCYNVAGLGWNSGIQHFLFTLMLLNLLFTYLSVRTQFIAAVMMCLLRLLLYFYCRDHVPQIVLEETADIFLQVVTTIVVFLLLYICGRMLAKDSREIECKLKKYNEELELAANTDTLTKLWNRHNLMRYMEKKLTEPNDFISIAIGDIDYFKKVNDTYGHECGDSVLRGLADILRRQMEGNGVVARWGGEEFIFVFEGVNGDDAKIKLARVQNAIKKAVFCYGDLELKITMTFGLVEYDPKLKLHENIKVADDRLYIGKEAGRDRIIY